MCDFFCRYILVSYSLIWMVSLSLVTRSGCIQPMWKGAFFATDSKQYISLLYLVSGFIWSPENGLWNAFANWMNWKIRCNVDLIELNKLTKKKTQSLKLIHWMTICNRENRIKTKTAKHSLNCYSAHFSLQDYSWFSYLAHLVANEMNSPHFTSQKIHTTWMYRLSNEIVQSISR